MFIKNYNWKTKFLLISFMLGSLRTVEAQRIELPPLSCGIYDNVSIAEAECNGIFLLWGETLDSNLNKTTSIFQKNNYTEGESYRANVGPFYCQTCARTNEEGYGYVGCGEGK